MKLKRILSLILAAVMLLSATACGSKEAADTTAKTETSTEAATEQKMPETPNEDFVVVIDKENSAAVDAAERMVWQMKEKYGIDLEVIDHKEKAYVKEIVLGKTNRGEKIDTSKLILNEYEIKAIGEKVFIDGASDDGIYGGAVKLLNTCTDENGFNIAKDYAYKDTSGYPIEKLTINGNDISKYTILYPENASEKTMTGVSELQKYIEMSCGAKLEAKAGTDGDYAIILEEKTVVIEDTVRNNTENFAIRSEGNNIRIMGDAKLGVLYGCYDFIDDVIGWLYIANASGKNTIDYLSPRDELDISGLDYEEGSYMLERGYQGTPTDRDRHTKIKWCMDHRCHTFDALDNAPDGTSYSEQYVNQPCLTDETVYQVMLANVLKWLNEDPDCDIISISQNDNSNHCTCENCAAIDAEEGSPAGSLVRFLNRMAADIKAAGFGHVYIHTFAYLYSKTPPQKTKTDPMVIVEFGAIYACFNHSLNNGCNSESYGDSMEKWSEISGGLYYWDYPYNISQYATAVPYSAYRNLGAQFRFMADCNTMGYFPCGDYYCEWSFGSLRHYLISKLMWDPYMSEEEFEGHVKKFMEGYFGEGWEKIYEAYHLFVDNHTSCMGILYSGSKFTDTSIFFQYQKLRGVMDSILTDFDEAKFLSNSAYTWTNVDCNQLQFEFTDVNGRFDKLYKSSDPADNELAQEISKNLQDKMQKYKVVLAENTQFTPDFEYFTVRPERWRLSEYVEFEGYNPSTGNRYEP